MAIKLTVEVPLFFAFFAFLLIDSIGTNILIYRTCYIVLGFDKYNCSLLGKTNNNFTRELEKLVQPKADMIGLAKTVMDSVAAAILILFVGSWSDRFGRKPVIVVNLLGYITALLIMAVYSDIETASPWYMMLSSVPVILTGGGSCLLTVLLSSLTDTTTDRQRGFRMGVFEGIMALGSLLGSSSSSYIFNLTNYVIVYLLGALSCLVALLYTIFYIPESLENRETENKLKGLFEIRNVSGMFRTTFRRRSQYNRAVILLVIFALAVHFVLAAGDWSVMFLFLRAKFDWNLKVYTLYNGAVSVMWMLGTTLILYVIHHKLKVKESILIFVGFFSMICGATIQGLAQVDWLIYAAAVVKLPSASISPMTRSLISKSVNGDEVAKIFSVFTITNTLLGLVGAPVYTSLYNATLGTNPGIFNFVSAGGYVVNTLCLLVVLVLQSKTVPVDYSTLQPDNSEESTQNNQNVVNDVTDDREGLVVNS